jgi:hypothetical protein
MSDVELAIRYLAFRDQQTQYAGDLKQFLDDFCRAKNADLSNNPQNKNYYQSQLSQMNEAIDLGLQEFGDKYFCRKYSDGVYETRFNRAVFDVLVGALSHPEIRQWVTSNPGQMKLLYESVCRDRPGFVKSVETTTKSLESTRTRFTIWYSALFSSTGIQFPLPNIA